MTAEGRPIKVLISNRAEAVIHYYAAPLTLCGRNPSYLSSVVDGHEIYWGFCTQCDREYQKCYHPEGVNNA